MRRISIQKSRRFIVLFFYKFTSEGYTYSCSFKISTKSSVQHFISSRKQTHVHANIQSAEETENMARIDFYVSFFDIDVVCGDFISCYRLCLVKRFY